ncbi:MAG: hypothetical protein IPK81_15300 [Rhodospirillales bacterium]|nr:MAG: hypothetical protein IPK81_15300 [Rhodospirillales bacterium]
MRIVNPAFGVAPAGSETLKTGPVDWLKDPIVLFSNSKPNARELLDGLKARIATLRPVDNVGYTHKNSASQGAPADTLAHVAQNYRIALLALAD